MQFILDQLAPHVAKPLPEVLAAWGRVAEALGASFTRDNRVRLDQLVGPWESLHEYLIRGYAP